MKPIHLGMLALFLLTCLGIAGIAASRKLPDPPPVCTCNHAERDSDLAVLQGKMKVLESQIDKQVQQEKDLVDLRWRVSRIETVPILKAYRSDPPPSFGPDAAGAALLWQARDDIRHLRGIAAESTKLADEIATELKAAGYEP